MVWHAVGWTFWVCGLVLAAVLILLYVRYLAVNAYRILTFGRVYEREDDSLGFDQGFFTPHFAFLLLAVGISGIWFVEVGHRSLDASGFEEVLTLLMGASLPGIHLSMGLIGSWQVACYQRRRRSGVD